MKDMIHLQNMLDKIQKRWYITNNKHQIKSVWEHKDGRTERK